MPYVKPRPPLLSRAAVVLVAAALAGCAGDAVPTKSSQADAISEASRQLALQAEREHQYEVAAQHYRNLLEERSDDPMVVLALARNLRYAGKPQIATAVLKDFLPRFRNAAELRLELGKAYLAADDLKEAAPLLEELLAERDADWRVHSVRGILFDRQGDTGAALDAHRRAHQLAPKEPQTINNLALALAMDGDLDGAIGLLDPLVQSGAAPLSAIQNLSIFYALKGELAVAQTLARRSLPPEMAEEQVRSLESLAGKGPSALPPPIPPANVRPEPQRTSATQTDTRRPPDGSGPQIVGAPEGLRVRTGSHPGYFRLVFHWPEPVEYSMTDKEGLVTLSFAGTGTVDIERLRRQMPSGLEDVAIERSDDRLVVSVPVPKGGRVRHFAVDSRVVVDLLLGADADAPEPTAKPADVVSPRELPAEDGSRVAALETGSDEAESLP